MTPTQKEKIKTKLKKLANYMISNKISNDDIFQLCEEDPEIEIFRNIVGSRLNFFEWRVHPEYPSIECSTEGDIRINGTILQPKKYNGQKIIKYRRGRKTIDINVPLTVLSTFKQLPQDGKYTVGFRDENPDNCRIQNLYWRKLGE